MTVSSKMAFWRPPNLILEPTSLDFEAPCFDFGKFGSNFSELFGDIGHAMWEQDFLALVSFMGITQSPKNPA